MPVSFIFHTLQISLSDSNKQIESPNDCPAARDSLVARASSCSESESEIVSLPILVTLATSSTSSMFNQILIIPTIAVWLQTSDA